MNSQRLEWQRTQDWQKLEPYRVPAQRPESDHTAHPSPRSYVQSIAARIEKLLLLGVTGYINQ
ncbi:hypothetical protein LEMLEM_LOCUS21289, partial [Lemmus lemmus]